MYEKSPTDNLAAGGYIVIDLDFITDCFPDTYDCYDLEDADKTMTHASIKERILAAMPKVSFNDPATSVMIEKAQLSLAVTFPSWLRDLYLTCDGFSGPTDVRYLYPLCEDNGVVEFTLFLRNEWKLPWLNRCAVFSENGLGGSSTVHWGICDGKLIEWCYGDGNDFNEIDGDFISILKRQQSLWDELESDWA